MNTLQMVDATSKYLAKSFEFTNNNKKHNLSCNVPVWKLLNKNDSTTGSPPNELARKKILAILERRNLKGSIY